MTSKSKSKTQDKADEIGPVDYIVIEWPGGGKFKGEAWPLLIDLVDRGLIRILDVVFVKKEKDGMVRGLAVADFDGDTQLDVAVFEGASSGMLAQDDIDEAGHALEPGSAAAILVYENRWAAPFAAALRRTGGQLVASGRIPVTDLIEALDATESKQKRK